MFELNLFGLTALIGLTAFISAAVYLRLRLPLKYRQISQHVPSVTKTFWSEITFSLELGMKHPKGRCDNTAAPNSQGEGNVPCVP